MFMWSCPLIHLICFLLLPLFVTATLVVFHALVVDEPSSYADSVVFDTLYGVRNDSALSSSGLMPDMTDLCLFY